ncbi:MAG: hypothetical protein WD598_04025 [Acidimicrobiia bacterium]
MNRRARRAFALVLLTCSLIGVVPAGAAISERRLPPPDREDLVRIFDPKVEDLGFRTTRARLQNLDTYAIDPRGRHLAIYLEPIGDEFTDAAYVAAVTETAEVFLPLVFKRWKGLKSFDVCLEPLPAEDASEEPAPITQLLVTRPGLDDVDWKHAALADLIAASNKYESKESAERAVYLYFEPRLDTQSELVGAREVARLQ